MNLTPEMMTTIAVTIGVILVIALVGWLIFNSKKHHRGHGTTRYAPEHDRNVTHSQISNLSEKHDMVDTRLDRHERTVEDLNSRLAHLQADYDKRGRMMETVDRHMKELQEQIYELRQEHKILMQREDRQERDVHELQARLTGVTEGRYGDGR